MYNTIIYRGLLAFMLVDKTKSVVLYLIYVETIVINFLLIGVLCFFFNIEINEKIFI